MRESRRVGSGAWDSAWGPATSEAHTSVVIFITVVRLSDRFPSARFLANSTVPLTGSVVTSEADCWRGHRWEWVGFWLTVPLTGSVAASERHRWRVERMEHGAGTISDNKWYGFRTVVA